MKMSDELKDFYYESLYDFNDLWFTGNIEIIGNFDSAINFSIYFWEYMREKYIPKSKFDSGIITALKKCTHGDYPYLYSPSTIFEITISEMRDDTLPSYYR